MSAVYTLSLISARQFLHTFQTELFCNLDSCEVKHEGTSCLSPIFYGGVSLHLA